MIPELSYLEDIVATSSVNVGTFISLSVVSVNGNTRAQAKGSLLKKLVIKHKGFTTTIFKAGNSTAKVIAGKLYESDKSWLKSIDQIFCNQDDC